MKSHAISHPQLRGVNLGGWLVLERWMNEDVFEGTNTWSEYDLMKLPGVAERVEQHRRSYITEADFRWMSTHGVTIVRIPVGYWIFDGDTPYTPAIQYLDWAMVMAEEHDVKVLIDLHAAPGSQSSDQHSGRPGRAAWFDDRAYQDRTIDILCRLAERYRDNQALWGIELLNEPEVRGHYWQLVRFYRRAYAQLRKALRPGVATVFHDGFHPLLFAGSLWPRRNYPVVMDIHWYSFSLSRLGSFEQYLRSIRGWRRVLIWLLQRWQPVIVGEWSTVLPAPLLTGKSPKQREALWRASAQAQQEAYVDAEGWMYWSYRYHEPGMWSFRSLVEDGVLPFNK